MEKRISRTGNKRSNKYYIQRTYNNIEGMRHEIIMEFQKNHYISDERLNEIKEKYEYDHRLFPKWGKERIEECLTVCRILFEKNS